MTPFTGRHMAAIMIAFFGVVIVVNLIMARYAVGTFGGALVDNSYVASQRYNGWLDAAERQNATGWKAKISVSRTGLVTIEPSVPGREVNAATVSAVATHPVGRAPEQALTFTRVGDGVFVAQERLPAGRWHLLATVRIGDMEARFVRDLAP